MSMYSLFGDGPSPKQAARKLLDELIAVGAVRMEAHYSGGNDEGGTDDIKLFDKQGKQIEFETWVKDPGAPPDQPYQGAEFHPLADAADNVLATEFGSWAGDFSAGGTLCADVATKRVWTQDTYYEEPQETGAGGIEVQL